MLPAAIKEVIDAKADQVLIATVEIMNTVTRRAAEKQAATGIQGDAAKGPYVRAYFDYFKSAIGSLFNKTLQIVEISDAANREEIISYLDQKIAPFLTNIEQYVFKVSRARFSEEEPNLKVVYAKLRQDFVIELSIAQVKRATAQAQATQININGGSNFQVGDQNIQKH